jgi:6-pyruvoyltetrahydropterin/6-carboxytetrahydropterin synthase
MPKIQTEVTISTAHLVQTTKGPCSRLHGHNWRIVVTCEGDIQEDGMIVDFINIKELVKSLDHKLLLPVDICIINNKIPNYVTFIVHEKKYSIPQEDCEILGISSITAENLATWIFNALSNMYTGNFTVRVYESETSFVEV